MVILSFRLSNDKIEKYNKILRTLRIDGDNQSDRFRNLIEYLSEYFENGAFPIQEPFDLGIEATSQKVTTTDLIITALSHHEKNLDKIVERLENATFKTLEEKQKPLRF
jgi:hypothetical protein